MVLEKELDIEEEITTGTEEDELHGIDTVTDMKYLIPTLFQSCMACVCRCIPQTLLHTDSAYTQQTLLG